MSRRIVLYVYLTTGVAGLVLAFLLATYPLPTSAGAWTLWLVFALLAALATYVPIQILEKTNIDVASIPTLAAVIVLSPALSACLAFLTGFVPRRGRRIVWIETIFNACQSALNTALAALVFHWMVGPDGNIFLPIFWLAVIAACLVYHLSNVLLVSIVASLQTGIPWLIMVRRILTTGVSSDLVMFSLAALTALVAILFPYGLVLVIVPAVLLLVVMARQSAMQRSLIKANQDLLLAYNETLLGWSNALELRDHETRGHTERVSQMVIDLVRRMGIPEDDLEYIRRGALLHDIGKIGVPDGILNKPGPLTMQDWVVMRCHPQNAYDLLKPISYLARSLDIPYCHHEHWDGSGYPRGLKGEEIPMAARIFTIIDVWDALTNERPYRPAWEAQKAVRYIHEQSGILFDPSVVAAFVAYLHENSLDC
jgi:hypothetical protein